MAPPPSGPLRLSGRAKDDLAAALSRLAQRVDVIRGRGDA
jgi:hypothetical protein